MGRKFNFLKIFKFNRLEISSRRKPFYVIRSRCVQYRNDHHRLIAVRAFMCSNHQEIYRVNWLDRVYTVLTG
jgi:hypothetical protein